MGNIKAEYIWIDGHQPTAKLRSKTKNTSMDQFTSVDKIPIWGFGWFQHYAGRRH